MITKKDYIIALVAGLLTGTLLLFISFKLRINFSYKIPIFFILIPLVFVFGVWFGKFLGHWIPFFTQFGKFAVVGLLSAAIDFSVLNIVSAATGITAGITVGWVNIPGFIVATINGYLWNKLWVFKNIQTPDFASKISSSSSQHVSELYSAMSPEILSAKSRLFKDFPKFISVTTIGLLINSGLMILVTTYIKIPHLWFTISAVGWLNIAKIGATATVMVWNFLGYKFFAFKNGKR